MRGPVGLAAAFAATFGLSQLVLVASPPAGAAPLCTGTTTVTCTFSFTGAADSFVVPAGVTSLTVDAFGGQGGGSVSSAQGVAGPSAAGGLGGHTRVTLSVTPGETLQVNVGGRGGNPSATTTTASASAVGGLGGFNGGGCGLASDGAEPLLGMGTGGAFTQQCGSGTDSVTGVGATAACGGGGGGGASDVRQGGTLVGNRVVVAGGGGGAGCATVISTVTTGSLPVETFFASGDGGAGGGLIGSPGAPGSGAATGAGGGGGTQLGGGVAGVPDGISATDQNGAGPTNAGANITSSGSTSVRLSHAGSGGGGFFGGGSGGVVAVLFTGGTGGGGGGSGFPATATFEQGVRTGDGLITITYTMAPAAVVGSPSLTG